jgi:imidazolonepropionase-like amidohydrolase
VQSQGRRSGFGVLLRAAALGALLPTATLAAAELRIEHATVVSAGRAARTDAEVIVRDGRIVALARAPRKSPPLAHGTQVLDATGLYLAPGLIDSHVHLGGIPGMSDEQEQAHPDIARAAREQFPKSYLAFGFTTLIDLISTREGMARWKSHDPVPDTYFCGGAPLIDGYPLNYIPRAVRYSALPYMIVEPGTKTPLPPQVEAAAHTPQAVVTRMQADGAICVKTFFERGFGDAHDLPVPQPETIRALVRAAHAAGLPVLMHANSAEAQSFALDGGVDIIAHGLWNTTDTAPEGELTPAMHKVLDRVIASGTGWQATTQVMYGLRELFGPEFLADPRLPRAVPRSLIDWYGTREGQWFHDTVVASAPGSDPRAQDAKMRENFGDPIGRVTAAVGYLAKHGARILFGTDTPSAPTYANPPGLNGWLEMQHLNAAGMSAAQIFEAATLANARAFKLDHEIGTVEPGKRANLLLLRADPRVTIAGYEHIVKVILGGRVLDPATLAAERAP